MPGKPSVKRYALALYQLAQEKSVVEEWQADLQTLDEALQEKEFVAFLGMPKIRLAQKMNVVREVLPSIDPMIHNFLGVLVSRNMVDTVSSVMEEYGKMLDQSQGRERAHVVSAVTLEAVHMERLASYLGELVGKEIELTASVDPSIVAGFVARVGDRLIDGSTRTRLQALKKSLAEVTYSE
jgi:F-type H+-transporting ATPase subunit delta